MELMTGTELSEAIKQTLKDEISTKKLILSLSIILVGDNPVSHKYVNIKKREAENIGISFKLHHLDEKTEQEDILKLIEKLNSDTNVTGIIVQLPLPSHFDQAIILESIDPSKDVDGLTSANLEKLEKGQKGLFPATPEGVINLLRYYQIGLKGKTVTVVGRSKLVGTPLAMMLEREGANVLVGHSKTSDLSELTLQSDIVISAAGKPGLISKEMIKNGTVVIDIGTTMVENRIVGDVDFDEVSKVASFITPPIGGVGPMTVAMLLSNVVKASKLSK